jgi:hypothetical protein
MRKASRQNKLWQPIDTERRLDYLNAGCKDLEEAAKRFPQLSYMRVSQCWRNRAMGRAIRKGDPELFQVIHERWSIEHKANGNVISKVDL